MSKKNVVVNPDDNPQGKTIKIVCCVCGHSELAVVSRKLTKGAEVFNIALHLGMKPAIDKENMRVLVFCSDKCKESVMIEEGRFNIDKPTRMLSCKNS